MQLSNNESRGVGANTGPILSVDDWMKVALLVSLACVVIVAIWKYPYPIAGKADSPREAAMASHL